MLADRNADARGIWSGSEVMWVLDGRRDALFAYDLETGDLLGEYELAPANSDPRGLWSDGVSVWVSDHGAKRIFAYRLPGGPHGARGRGRRRAAARARARRGVRTVQGTDKGEQQQPARPLGLTAT